MGQGCQVENVNHCGHVCMDQAYQLEVASSWKIYGIGLAARKSARIHARSASVAGSIGRTPWASRLESGSYLAIY